MDQQEQACRDGLVLVVRKSAYGLPTACPVCLPAYIYLRFANISFNTHYHLTSPDSEDLPSLEYGDFAGFNSQTGGIFDILKKEGIADLDSEIPSHIVPDWLSFKALISSWLTDATLYELWVNQNDYVVSEIYFANLPWPIGKILYWKQRRTVMQQLGITCSNGQERASELYRNAAAAYESLSMKLEDQTFFFENRPTSLDAIFLGHALFILQTPINSSTLKQELMKHDNLIRYVQNLKNELFEANSSSPLPRSPPDPASSSTNKSQTSHGGTRDRGSKKKDTKPTTEEEKILRKRAKYFLITQFIAVITFLMLMGGYSEDGVEMEEEDGMMFED